MRSFVAVLLLAVATTASARRLVPPSIEFDGCVMPSSACEKTNHFLKLLVDGRTVEFAVEKLRVLSTTGATTGQILTELERMPVRLEGPKEVTDKLEPGSRRRVRGLLRLPARYMLLQAIEPLGEKR